MWRKREGSSQLEPVTGENYASFTPASPLTPSAIDSALGDDELQLAEVRWFDRFSCTVLPKFYRKPFFILVGFVVLTGVAITSFVLLHPGASEPQGVNPFSTVQGLFNAAHSKAAKLFIEDLENTPVILQLQDRSLLWISNEIVDSKPFPDNVTYEILRVASHIPVGAAAVLGDVLLQSMGHPLTFSQMDTLRSYSSALQDLGPQITADKFWSQEQYDRQLTIINVTSAFVAKVIFEEEVNPFDLLNFTTSLGDVLLSNAADAGRIAVDTLLATSQEWRQTMTPMQWATLLVVVQGPEDNQKDNLALQFFADLLNSTAPELRIFYTTEYPDASQGDQALASKLLDCVADRFVDRALDVAFFGVDAPLDADIIGASSTAYLKSLHEQGKLPSFQQPSVCPFARQFLEKHSLARLKAATTARS